MSSASHIGPLVIPVADPLGVAWCWLVVEWLSFGGHFMVGRFCRGSDRGWL